MDEQDLLIPEHGEDKNLLKLFMVQNGAPAFILRAKMVQVTWEVILAACQKQRDEWLAMVRVRLGMLVALAGDWSTLLPWLGEVQLAALRALHDELQPKLRVTVAPTRSRKALRRALVVLGETLQRFNRRWERFLADVDLTAANAARDKYNRYYVLEKECVVGSTHLARRGFTRMPPLTVEDVATALPLLPKIEVRGE